jgi:hypothetical protein
MAVNRKYAWEAIRNKTHYGTCIDVLMTVACVTEYQLIRVTGAETDSCIWEGKEIKEVFCV